MVLAVLHSLGRGIPTYSYRSNSARIQLEYELENRKDEREGKMERDKAEWEKSETVGNEKEYRPLFY